MSLIGEAYTATVELYANQTITKEKLNKIPALAGLAESIVPVEGNFNWFKHFVFSGI